MHQSGRKPKLLKDYAPPAYLIEEVDLDFALDPIETRVAAKLKVRPNPKVATGGRPLVLDGEGLALKSLALNGKRLSPERLRPHGNRAHHRLGSGRALHP